MMHYLAYTHIIAGVISLVVAPIALVVHKGGNAHRLWGKVFAIAMTWVFISAVVLSLYAWKPFLLMLAVFSYYLVVSGYRSLYQKQLYLGKGIKWYDWVVAIVSAIFNLCFIGWGVVLLVAGKHGVLPFLALGFGAGGMILTTNGLRSFLRKPTDKHHWFYTHIGNMVGGFIASVTAFSTQVLDFLPGAWPWIWPSLVGVPLIIFHIRTYRKKIGSGARLNELVELGH